MTTYNIPSTTIYATVQYSDWYLYVVEQALRQALEKMEVAK